MGRKELREHIFKMLFQIEFNKPEEMPDNLKYYFETLENAADKDKDYIQKKYEAVVEKVPQTDALLNESSKGWRTGRMNKVDLTILRLAVYEMLWDEEVPVGVAINEAVELAKKFGGPESSSFVNGVLGKISRQPGEGASSDGVTSSVGMQEDSQQQGEGTPSDSVTGSAGAQEDSCQSEKGEGEQ